MPDPEYTLSDGAGTEVEEVGSPDYLVKVNLKLDGLSSATLADTDIVPVQTGTAAPKKATIAALFTFLWTLVAGATAKTTPVDADSIPITDSEASSVVKKLTFAYLWTWIKAKITADTTPTLGGNLDADGNRLTNLGAPSAAADAATKTYVDNLVAGQRWKSPVRFASTANVDLATAAADGDTIDGGTIATGDRILYKNQTDPIENGIYITQASGAPVRADDLPAAGGAASAVLFVEEGSANADKQYVCQNDAGSDVVGTDELTWTQTAVGGVASVFGRTGAVLPVAGDYDDTEVEAPGSATGYTPTTSTVRGHLAGLGTAVAAKLPLAGGTMTGPVAMGNNGLTGLGAQTWSDEAAGTIAAGSLTPSGPLILVTGEGSADDDLTTIATAVGTLKLRSAGQAITLKDHGSDVANKVRLPGGLDLDLQTDAYITLYRKTTSDVWRLDGAASAAVKHNFVATTAPGLTDDETDGYGRTSLWYDTVVGILYQLVDPTTDNAVWLPISPAPVMDYQTITGSPATDLDLTFDPPLQRGESADVDITYVNAGTLAFLLAYFEGDTTATNSDVASSVFTTSSAHARDDDPRVAYAGAGETYTGRLTIIVDMAGRVTMLANGQYGAPSAISRYSTATTRTATVTSLGGLKLRSSVSSQQDVGTHAIARRSGSAGVTIVSGEAPTGLTINNQTGTTYTPTIDDAEAYVRLANASAITFTVPPNASVPYTVGDSITLRQAGAGQVTVAEGSGVTVNTPETLLLRAQHSTATLIKVNTDEWDLVGDLETA